MQNSLPAMVLGALFLGSCANTPKPLSYRQQLDMYKDMKVRLYQVAAPLQAAGSELCEKTESLNLDITHNLSDYPAYMRPVAKSYWSLGNEDITIAKIKYDKEPVVCYMPLGLDYALQPNAYTDGESVFVTPVLLSEVDDLGLALIIAHELGHIVLKHVDMEPSKQLEQDADRFALFILARAGLDYRKAALQNAASRQPHLSEEMENPEAEERAQHFQKTVLEIDRLKARSKTLIP